MTITASGENAEKALNQADEKISALLENTGYKKINLNGNNVTVLENMQIDLGAVSKKPGSTDWKLGLRSPFDEGNFATLEISEFYRRRQRNLLAHSGFISVTIVGKEGRLCDALST